MEQECCFGRIVFDNIPHTCDMGLMYLGNLSLVHLLWVVHPVSPWLMSTKEIMRKHQSYITDMEEAVFETTINLPKFFNNAGWQEVFKFSPAMWCECTVLPCNTLHCILLRFIYNLIARVSHPPTLTEQERRALILNSGGAVWQRGWIIQCIPYPSFKWASHCLI